VRRKYAKYQGMKIVHHDGLRAFVKRSLLDGLSPPQIAGRLRSKERTLPPVSKDTVYRFLRSTYGNRIALVLAARKRRRRGQRGRRTRLGNRTFIDQRPLYIGTRRYVGDAEADFVVSGKSGKGILLVVVDRKTRMAFLERILPVSISRMEAAFLRIKARFPELRSVTTDNDILFQKHRRLAGLLRTRIYFCLPHHPWEKGTVEYMNREIRKEIPKGSDLSKYAKRFTERLEAKLNRRPMAVLRYRTPAEALAAHRNRSSKTKKPR
jgi:transposase, IS30 family